MQKPNMLKVKFYDNEDKLCYQWTCTFPLTIKQSRHIEEMTEMHFKSHPMGTVARFTCYIKAARG